jgi:hypothetical protein
MMGAGHLHLCAALMHTRRFRKPRKAAEASIHLIDGMAMTAELPTVTGG